VVTQRRQDLPTVAFPRRFEEQVAAISDAELLGEGLSPARELETMNLGRRIDEARKAMRRELGTLVLSITAIIHSRLAFSASVLVMLVLAAGLAVICRGGQLLTAFVISFVPGMVIVVMNVMGRHAVVLTRYLRR